MDEIRPVNTTYEPFSQEPEYIDANEQFVKCRDLGDVQRFLDLACGTGLVSGMLLKSNPRAGLWGIDIDPVQIDLAEQHLSGLGHSVRRLTNTSDPEDDKARVTLAVSGAEVVPFPDAFFDCVTICNAIHMVADKVRLLAEVARVSAPGGSFGFNTSFYAGTYGEGTEEHFYLWVSEADRYIKKLNEQRVAEGKERIKRARGQARGAFQNTWYTEDEWVRMLGEAGLQVEYRNARVVMLDDRCLKAIAAYGGFAEILLSGYPIAIASEALQATAPRSLELLGATALPRKFFEVWARRT